MHQQLNVEVLAYSQLPGELSDPRITEQQRQQIVALEGYEINGRFYPLGELLNRIKLAFSDIPQTDITTKIIITIKE